MKMKTTLFSLFLAIGALAITACSKEDNNDREEEATFQAVQFRMAEEGFGTETELTRASSIPSAPALSEVGDCEAETTLESEPAEKPTAATRGVTTPTHYTIRIYEGSTLKGEMKGTFTATGFMPDAGSPTQVMLARNHTYTFLCFNDQVTPVGDKLEVVLANAATARIGRQQIILGTTDQVVNLSSKHVGVRVRSHIVAKKDIPTALTATLQGSNIPQRVSYNPADGTYTTVATGALATSAITSPASTQAKFTASNYGQTYAYTSTATNYYYVLPTTDSKDLKLNFTGGKIFWNTLTGPTSGLTKTSRPLTANASYRATVKMKPAFTYLMSNGDLGTFKETTFGGGTKIPIAVVIDKDNRIGVALNRNNPAPWSANAFLSIQANTHMADVADALNSQATSGLDETWDPSYSTASVTGNKIKGLNPDFPVFKAAADYNPGTYTGSPALKWYLPSLSDYKWFALTLGFVDQASIIQPFVYYPWYGELVQIAFTQVSSRGIIGYIYWTSSETLTGGAGRMSIGYNNIQWGFAGKFNPLYVHPFVKY